MSSNRMLSLTADYFLNNFLIDYNRNKQKKVVHEEKTDVQKKFEKYLLANNIIVVDYSRVVQDRRYYNVVSNVLTASNKKHLLYSAYDLSYKSNVCMFYKYDIPKNSTEKQFKNIYNYLFVDTDRPCLNGCSGDPYYFCINCGVYACRKCVDKDLKWMLIGSTDYGYIICGNCSNHNILYKLPAYFDI